MPPRDGSLADTLPIRKDLAQTMARTWQHIAAPGTWMTSAVRLAVAAETRMSLACAACREKAPAAQSAGHATFGELEPAHVSIIHRLRNGHNGLSQSWVNAVLTHDLTDGEYVETVSIVALVTALDTFADAMGISRQPLPRPIPGEISGYRPSSVRQSIAWVPTIEPDEASGAEADIYAEQTAAHIHRALTLVPAEKRAFFELDEVMYLPDNALRKFDRKFREINHGQIELLAARVSALNRCFY